MILFLIPLLILCMHVHVSAEIIPNAAYAIVKKEGAWFKLLFETLTNRHNLPYKTVFYTFDGKPLKEIAGIVDPLGINRQLDPSAPAPQPVTFKIIWHDFRITPKHYIHFYDKHGNEIQWFIHDGTFPIKASDLKKYETKHKKFIKHLDLSIVKNMTRSWTDQMMWHLFNRQLLQ